MLQEWHIHPDRQWEAGGLRCRRHCFWSVAGLRDNFGVVARIWGGVWRGAARFWLPLGHVPKNG